MAERRILNSWKEIATYVGRGVRTVQRWEAQIGLPVHRPAGKDHSAVLAFSSELDQWLDKRPLRNSLAVQPLSGLDPIELQTLLQKADALLEKCEVLLLRNDELSRKISTLADALRAEQMQTDGSKSALRRAEAGAA